MRAFRDRLALQDHTADPKALGTLDEAITSRLQRQAQGAATDTNPNDDLLDELERDIQSIPAWVRVSVSKAAHGVGAGGVPL